MIIGMIMRIRFRVECAIGLTADPILTIRAVPTYRGPMRVRAT
jgi:hypothetical protein